MYPTYNVNITVYIDSMVNPSIIDLLDGSVIPITNFTITDSSVIFDSLPISDHPYLLIFDQSPGIAEYERITEMVHPTFVPNPFTGSITIDFTTVPSSAGIELDIYDVSGCRVRSFKPPHAQNASAFVWYGNDDNGLSLPSGIYFIRLHAGDYQQTEKVLLIR